MNAPNASGWKPAMGDGSGEAAPTSSGDAALMLEEKLIFELAGCDTTGVDFDEQPGEIDPALDRFARKQRAQLPGLSEPETVRHYTRLSRQTSVLSRSARAR